ncbi:MAG: hypothetical protein DMG72_07265 [Acidobacteria bacterium]|nr:MAG: hypothetical protein DMG72_07265 [Acidobacteriota bacterium]
MPLSSGTMLGPYEIQAAIGAGGMGEVYRARDTRLERTVAIKVLPAAFSHRPDLRKRLEREARTLSSLSHPHICDLYDVGQQDGVDFLVMEYLEGETLAHRLLKGPVAAEQLLKYGMQMADALDRAHRHGITHRDLKPGNIMLTKDGAKLLDFGLARMETQAVPVAETLIQLATEERKLTEEGVILGTFQYMAPEQLEGKEADSRTDIFALGAVLYEMATGKSAFTGKTQASLIAAILASEPPAMTSLQPLTPPALERVVKTSLAKDPDSRWQSAQDLKLQLEWIAEGGSQLGVPAPVAKWRRSREQLARLVAGLLGAAVIVLGIREYQHRISAPVVTRFVVNPPEQHSFNDLNSVKVSPDGGKLALRAADPEGHTSLWLRPLDSASAHELPGTAGAQVPVWSSDSRFLLFVAEGKLKRIDTSGGLPDVLCDVKDMSVQSWNSGGTVLLSYDLDSATKPVAIQQLSLEDCSIKPVTKLDMAHYDFGHQWPSFLPDGRHFVYAGLRTDKKQDVLLGTLESEASETLIHNASNPKYAPPGYLFFERNGYLFAQPFSLRKLHVAGAPVQVVSEQLLFGGLGGIASYDVSTNGVLVYQDQGEVRNKLVLLDSGGKRPVTLAESGNWSNARLAPARKKLLVSKNDTQAHTSELWTYDLQRNNWERFSFESSPADHLGIWSPDGQTIVYAAVVKGNYNLYRKPTDRSREAEPLLENDVDKLPNDWSPDGRFLLYTQKDTKGAADLWVLPITLGGKPFQLTDTRFSEGSGHFRPDGQWIAYSSDESGKNEIYVRPFPGSGSKWQISAGGGSAPQWSQDGKKIYYLTPDWKLVEISVKTGGSVEVGTPRLLFSLPQDSEYEVSEEGKVVVNEQLGQWAGPTVVTLNWNAALVPNK